MKDNFAYDSVAKALYTDHIKNKLDVGDALPTEQELIDYYKVSRTTVRRGIQKLVNNDLVYTVSGSGSFVKGQKQGIPRMKKIGFSERAKLIGSIPKTEVLEFQIEEASPKIAEKLKIIEGDLVYQYKRLRYLNDIPDHIEVGFLPVALFPDLSMEVLAGSKYHYIEEIKTMVIKKTLLTIEPMLLDDDTAKLFKTKSNIPVDCIKTIGFLNDGTIFEYTESIRNSNKFNLIFEIYR